MTWKVTAHCTLVFGLGFTFAAETAAQELVVPYERNYPPFSLTSPTGGHDGYNVAVARSLADAAGLDVRFEAVGFFEIADGGWPAEWGFAVASVSYLVTREGLYTYLGQYLYDEVVLLARSRTDGETAPPVAGSRIGVCRACAYRDYLEGRFEQTDGGEPPAPPFKRIEIDDSYTNETDMIKVLTSSAAPPFDFVVASRFFADFIFIRAGYPIEIASDPLYIDPLWVIASNDHPEIHEPLRAALEQLRANGTLIELSIQYLGADFTSTPN